MPLCVTSNPYYLDFFYFVLQLKAFPLKHSKLSAGQRKCHQSTYWGNSPRQYNSTWNWMPQLDSNAYNSTWASPEMSLLSFVDVEESSLSLVMFQWLVQIIIWMTDCVVNLLHITGHFLNYLMSGGIFNFIALQGCFTLNHLCGKWQPKGQENFLMQYITWKPDWNRIACCPWFRVVQIQYNQDPSLISSALS